MDLLRPARRVSHACLAAVLAAGLTGAVLASLAAAPGVPAVLACACGGAISDPEETVTILDETAIVAWDGAVETITLALDAETDAADFALLVPTPAPAEAALGDASLFADLADISAPRSTVTERRWWPEGGDSAGGVGAPAGAPGVEVLSEVRLGPLEVTTLAASQTQALTAWLDEHGYVMTDTFASALEPYVADGWSYVAVRIAPDAQEEADLTGELQPVALTFDSDELVYPMRLSAAAQTAQDVRTYVVADHRMDRTDVMAEGAEVVFAGTLTTGDVEVAQILGHEPSAALTDLLEGRFLTTIDQHFAAPGEQIRSDFTFARADRDAEVVRTYGVTQDVLILGTFAGPVLVAGGVLVLVAGATLALVLARRRRT